MKEYIEREVLLKTPPFTKRGGELCEYVEGYLDCVEDACKAVREAPAADVAPVSHGHWIHITDLPYDAVTCECSRCTNYTSFSKDHPSNFCPTCGADMRGVNISE